MRKILSVVVNYNGSRFLYGCIESLVSCDSLGHTVYIVDNDSSDDSLTRIRPLLDKYSEKIILHRMEKNQGYAAAANVGLKYAMKNGYQFVGVYNCDLTFDKAFLIPLIDVIQHDNSVAIAYPEMMSLREERQGLDHFGKVPENHEQGYTKKVKFFGGAAFLTSCSVLDRVGLFDEDYFLYYEDTDLCARIAKAGMLIVKVYDSIVYHYAGGTSVGLKAVTSYYNARNVFLFVRKNMRERSLHERFVYIMRNLRLHFARRGILHPIVFFNIICGIIDGLIGRVGQRA